MSKYYFSSSFIALAFFSLASQANADPVRIESIHRLPLSANLAGRTCSQPHNTAGDGDWHEGDQRLISITNKGKVRFEVFGHWIDTWIDDNPNIRVSDIAGMNPRMIEGTNGATNAARGCGAIGSAVIELTIPPGNAYQSGQLFIADARPFTIELFPREVRNIEWSSSNRADGTHDDGSSSYQQRLAEYQRNLPALTADYQACLQIRQAQIDDYNARRSAAAGSGDKIVVPPGGPKFKECYEPKPPSEITNPASNRTLASCGDRFGLISRIRENDLDITLPAGGIPLECAQKPLPLEFEWAFGPFFLQTAGNFVSSGDDTNAINYQPNNFSSTGNGPNPRFVVPSDSEINSIKRKINVQFNPQDIMQLVGEYERTITHDQGSSAHLIIRSSPNYGVARLAGPLFQNLSGKSGERTASTGRLTMTSVQPAKQGQLFKWSISGTNVAQCFRAINGSFSPSVNATATVFEVEATNNPVCNLQNYTVTIGPEGQETNPIFARTITFALPSLVKQFIPNDKPKITTPSGLSIG